MNGKDDKSTYDYAKDLLGDPEDPSLILESLSPQQKMGLAIARLAQTLDGLQTTGCHRLRRVERKVDVTIKAVGIIVALTGFIYIVILIAQATHGAAG